jgi:hypothetical protein
MKRLLFFCFISLAALNVFSQDGSGEFMHSLGGKYFVYGNTSGFTGGAILYSPRYNFASLGANSTVSAGTHLGIGFSLTAGPGGSASSLILDLPAVAELNFGYGSSKEAEGGFGGFIGAGYGLHRVTLSVDGYGSSATITGPVFGGGVRFEIPRAGAFEIGASYMIDLKDKDQKVNILGISFSYLLGMGRGD